MAENDYKPVIFENSLGEIISNDPVYLAQRTLARAGINYGSTASTDDDDAIDDVEVSPYAELKGAALKAAAADKGVDIKGLKTVGEVRAALTAHDEAEAAAAEAESDDDAAGDNSDD